MAPNSAAQETETRAWTLPCLRNIWMLMLVTNVYFFQKTNHIFGVDVHFVEECNLVKKVAGAWPGLM